MTKWELGYISVGGEVRRVVIGVVGYNVSKSIVQRQQEGGKVYGEASNILASSIFLYVAKIRFQ